MNSCKPTQDWISRITGISQGQVSRLLGEVEAPSELAMRRVEAAFGWTLLEQRAAAAETTWAEEFRAMAADIWRIEHMTRRDFAAEFPDSDSDSGEEEQ